jgi:carbohydrate-selective porin OprB
MAQSLQAAHEDPDLASLAITAWHDLNDHGVSAQGVLIYDWSLALHDDESNSGFGRYSFDVSMPIDGSKLWHLDGSSAMVRLRHHMNNFGGDQVGEIQLFSNIDAPQRTNLYEAWIEQKLVADKIRLKVGKIDANTEFATVQTAGDFLNSSMGFSPTIVAFPTYPEPKLGFNAFLRPTKNNSLGVGVFQTSTAGTLEVIEPARTWNLGESEKPGRVSVGLWHLGGNLARFNGTTASGTLGFYSVMEQSLWRPSNGHHALSGFLQLGLADGHVSPFEKHVGGGAILQGIFLRPKDSIGIAATWVRFSSDPAAAFALPGEMVFETYYKASFSKHLAFVQDFQYVHHAGGLQASADCPVFTPRLVLSF